MRHIHTTTNTPMLFYRLPQHIAKCFTGKFLIAQTIAVLFSIAIVTSGLDWTYHVATRGATLRAITFPALPLGGLLPIVVPFLFLFFGIVRKKKYLLVSAWGLAQSALLGLLISSFYKAWTGRIPPRFLDVAQNVVDISHGFQFGFLRGGVFWGWPSSHTTVAFAMAGAFAMLFPKQKVLKYLVFSYAGYVAFGVSVSIHWLSEAVVGAILGTVIGLVVGAGFSKISATPPSSMD